MTLVTVPCAVCQGTTFTTVYRGTIVDDGADPSRYFGSSRAIAGYLRIVRCSTCGLMMTNPQDDRATLASVYATQPDEVYEREYENRRRAALDHLTLVNAHHPQAGRILDVGCATGAFVCVARDAGWQATGLDTSEWMVQRARARCPGVTFEVGGLEAVDFSPGAFEVITLWDVLEHVSSPRETLERLRRCLHQGGWLFLSMPNAASYSARWMGRRWVLLLREHLWYFSPKTIAKLLSQVGFDLVETRPKAVRFSVANVLRRLAQYPGAARSVAATLAAMSLLNRIPLRFPMGEMDVVARTAP
jgi:2-polyprenyl-3-methyl-5-hydroxy-6-metoxy-1,4-benzoquinol methylase